MNQYYTTTSKRTGRAIGVRLLVAAIALVPLVRGIIDMDRAVQAEVFDIGGEFESFKGGGDKRPPRCQLDVPRAAGSPFFVQWNCTDNFAADDEIKTELWIYRKGATAGRLLASFLGFPASVLIDEGVLQVENFQDGLPFQLRLRATDRAGVSTITPLITVFTQDNSVDACSLSIVTEATDSDGTTTGLPSMSVSASNVSVSASQVNQSDIRVVSISNVTASPCEIDSICGSNGEISFQASLTLSGTEASGTVIVSPGTTTASVSGTATVEDATLSSLDVSASVSIDGVPAELSLSCAQR